MLSRDDYRLEIRRQFNKGVFNNDIEEVTSALKNGADPNFSRSYTVANSILGEAVSPEMVSLLLQYGADSRMEYRNKKLWRYFYDNKKFDLLEALASNEPCALTNNEINDALYLLIKDSGVEYRAKKFDWESKKNKCMLSLMRASTELRMNTRISHDTSPFSYASKRSDDVFLRQMFENNFILSETLKYEAKLKDYSRYHYELPEAFYTKIVQSLLILNTPEIGIPFDIVRHIILFLAIDPRVDLFRNYQQENIKLENKKSSFGILYEILMGDSKNVRDDFWSKHEYLTPSSFFKKTNNEALKYDGDVRFILSLLKKHEIKSDNKSLVIALTDHYISKHEINFMFVGGSREELMQEIMNQLPAKEIEEPGLSCFSK